MGEESGRPSELALAQVVARAVQQTPGVAGLSPGRLAEVVTYGPGMRVRSVAVRRGAAGLEIAVHLRAVYTPALALPILAEQARHVTRQAIAAVAAEPIGSIDIAIDDLVVAGGEA